MPTTVTRTETAYSETFNGGAPGEVINSGNSVFAYDDGTPGPSYWAPAPMFRGGGVAGFDHGPTPSGKNFNNYTYLECDPVPPSSSSTDIEYGPAPETWEQYYDYYVFINGPSGFPYDTWENFWDWVQTFAADNSMTTDELWVLFYDGYFPTGQAEYITYTYINHRLKSYRFDIRWTAIPRDPAGTSGSDSITTELRLSNFSLPITVNINAGVGNYQPTLETWYRYGAEVTDPTPEGDFFGPMTWRLSDLGGTPLLTRSASYYTNSFTLSTILKVNSPTYTVSVEYRDVHYVVETQTTVTGSEVWYPDEPPFVRGSCGCSGGSQALTSYMNLCGNEIVNAARTSRYIQHGLVPNGFSFKCDGCEGLVDILPCLGDEPLAAGYQLPELDNAPWYDPQVPESKNFAGLYVLSATMSAPYSRSVTPNIGVGSSLGRLKLNGRNIVVRGWLVGKTCCSVQYGLKWLTDALGGDPCGSGDCGGCDLDFLRCCPSIGDAEDSCLVTGDEYGHQTIYVRPDSDSEYQRAEDFFARMHNVGVVDGPHVLSCKGGSCGCGCGTILEVEFTLHAGSPYMNSLAEEIFTVDPFPGCEEDDSECPVVWQLGPTCESSARCQEPPDCLEDPKCPAPKLPPAKGRALPLGCGCIPLRTETFCSSIIPQKDWGSSTLNFEVYAGSKPIRNLAIRVFQNPQQRDCGDRDFFDECEACATLIVNYVPAGGTLRFSGEERTVTVTCGAKTRSAARNISGLDELPFDWPDLSCVPMCACVTIDCASTASDASMRIFRVDRSL